MNLTDKPVLITGTSSGIGKHLTKHLAAMGCPVYAAARKDLDLNALKKIPMVTPLRLDVTNQDDINNAVQVIKDSGSGLYGIVNNAGRGDLGMLASFSDNDMYALFDVNVFGPHRITNALVGNIIEKQGRIVNIGSQGGMITKSYFGAYSMTKIALEAYSEALSTELLPYSVHVSIVQPGGIVSDIGKNSLPGIIKRLEMVNEPFKKEANNLLKAFTSTPDESTSKEQPESDSNRKSSSPSIVTDAVNHALFDSKPKLHYLVGTKWEGDRVLNALIIKLLHENNNPMHNYSRDELVTMLDKNIEKLNLKYIEY